MDKYGGMISPELYGSPTNSHLVAKQEELGEGNDTFILAKYLCS
jgi:hypothetical protein